MSNVDRRIRGVPALEVLRDVAKSVATAESYRLVALFGSVARGDQAPRDLDLGVLGRQVDVVAATNRFMELLRVSEIDVVDLGRANPVLLMAVARDGVPLFEATGTEFGEFSSLAMRRYADTKKFRDAVREDLRDYVARARRPE